MGVDPIGECLLLGSDLSASEDKDIWLAFPRSLVKSGLKTVQLVINVAHECLRKVWS